MFIFKRDSKLASVRVCPAHEPVAIKTHRTAIAISIPFWRPSQFHLKVNTMSPVMIQLFYDPVIIDFWITLILRHQKSKNVLKMLEVDLLETICRWLSFIALWPCFFRILAWEYSFPNSYPTHIPLELVLGSSRRTHLNRSLFLWFLERSHWCYFFFHLYLVVVEDWVLKLLFCLLLKRLDLTVHQDSTTFLESVERLYIYKCAVSCYKANSDRTWIEKILLFRRYLKFLGNTGQRLLRAPSSVAGH